MKLLIADVSNIFHSAWHAGADKPVGFAYEVTVDRVRRSAEGFDRVVVACDRGRSFRKDISPAYKASRPDREPMLLEQLRRVQKAFEADGYAVVAVEGFEADDVIATIASKAAERSMEVVILSSDKDLLALVSHHVSVRSVRTNELLKEPDVVAKLNVRPEQVRDYLALVGDASDGVRGVPGVGPRHASRLLGQFGSVGGIVEALDAKGAEDRPVVQPPSVYSALCTALQDGTLDMAIRLISLRRDLPIDLDRVLELRAPVPQRPDFGSEIVQEADVDNDDKEELPQPKTIEATAETSAAIVPVESRWALEPRRMRDAVWLAGKLFESRLLAGYGSPEQVLAIVLAGREMGLGAMTALRGIHVIKGRIAMGSQLMVGLCLSSGKADYFDLLESDAAHARYVTRRNGSPREVAMTFTIEQARDIGLLKPSKSGEPTMWDKDPENMLRHRCAARLARVAFPDVVANTYLPEELDDGAP